MQLLVAQLVQWPLLPQVANLLQLRAIIAMTGFMNFLFGWVGSSENSRGISMYVIVASKKRTA